VNKLTNGLTRTGKNCINKLTNGLTRTGKNCVNKLTNGLTRPYPPTNHPEGGNPDPEGGNPDPERKKKVKNNKKKVKKERKKPPHTCSLHKLCVQKAGDQRLGQVVEETFQYCSNGTDWHIKSVDVHAGICTDNAHTYTTHTNIQHIQRTLYTIHTEKLFNAAAMALTGTSRVLMSTLGSAQTTQANIHT
jgi:hypothetical protein